ncbi:NAD(P)-binding domain-containing protein [Chitinophaga sp.]|uniref:NADPH-dependent F420 reductase n=1 Tax=Chitinophaga sp. TaxID=1869181 RepID=UPI0031D6CF05
MKIGIIGSGNIGGTLARKCRELNYPVLLTNSRGPESLKEFADETGVTPVALKELIGQSDLIILSIPQKSIPALPAGIFKDKIVVDTCNYYPDLRDGRLVGFSEFTVDSEWVEEQIQHPVIKVFNSILAESLRTKGLPKGRNGRIGLPIAGDNAHSKKLVMQLVDELGFDPVDAGTIKESWKLHPGSPIYCADLPSADIIEKLSALTDADRIQLNKDRLVREKNAIKKYGHL